MSFVLGKTYSRQEISGILGGSPIAYLPYKDGAVVCGCFKVDPEYNPDAPTEVVHGRGPIVQKSAKMVSHQDDPIPVFLFQADCKWKYVGQYRCCGYSTDSKMLRRKERENPARGHIAGVLSFERVE